MSSLWRKFLLGFPLWCMQRRVRESHQLQRALNVEEKIDKIANEILPTQRKFSFTSIGDEREAKEAKNCCHGEKKTSTVETIDGFRFPFWNSALASNKTSLWFRHQISRTLLLTCSPTQTCKTPVLTKLRKPTFRKELYAKKLLRTWSTCW